ncbi:arginine--tRNA ligase [bacterium]|nr:arginine--tRNA ligase [bacterium]
MFKTFFLEEVENVLKNNPIGQMQEYTSGKLFVEKPKNPEFGDFSINVSPLARDARIAPPMIAQQIADKLSKKGYEVNVIAGFLNFKVQNELLKEVLVEVFEKNALYGKPESIEKEKIVLEYVSANPTGPFHIGHGRWAAMGSALANLLNFYGHEVVQEFYINDAGSQIQKLGKSLEVRVRQEMGEDAQFPTDEVEVKNYYTGDYLIPVAKKYLEAGNTSLEIDALSDYAKFEMERLQKELLENFRTHFDVFYSELELHKSGKVEQCVNKLKELGKLYEKDGAIWFKSSDYGDDQDRVIKKADGANTYLTADIAYHLDKLERGFDRLINIWGADHHGYIARVKASIESLGYDPNKLEVLLGQLVNLIINGEEVRMGKRRKMVTLDDLIEEVGVDATRFWMIMRSIDTTLDFDIELAKTASDENPVFYVQYAHARACSILKNVTSARINPQTGEELPIIMNSDEVDSLIKNVSSEKLNQLFEEEGIENVVRKLILKLEDYKNIIEYSAQNRYVYTICRYLTELSATFHSFYNATRVISDDMKATQAKLLLVLATKQVLKNALDIIGVSAPERM